LLTTTEADPTRYEIVIIFTQPGLQLFSISSRSFFDLFSIYFLSIFNLIIKPVQLVFTLLKFHIRTEVFSCSAREAFTHNQKSK